MSFNVEKIPLAALLASFAFAYASGQAEAQVPMSPGMQAIQIHDDLLHDYQSLGKNAEMEIEYKWLLNAKPSNAIYHYNYACYLKQMGRQRSSPD